MRLSQDLNADLDLERTSERLLEGVGAALGLREMALFLPGEGGRLPLFRARGVPRTGEGRPRIAAGERAPRPARPRASPWTWTPRPATSPTRGPPTSPGSSPAG